VTIFLFLYIFWSYRQRSVHFWIKLARACYPDLHHPPFAQVVAALRKGEIQAAILKAPVADYFAYRAPCDLTAVGQPFASSFFAVGVQPDSPYYEVLNQVVIESMSGGDIEKVSLFYYLLLLCCGVWGGGGEAGDGGLEAFWLMI
jgi:hypothetical protein